MKKEFILENGALLAKHLRSEENVIILKYILGRDSIIDHNKMYYINQFINNQMTVKQVSEILL